MADRLTLVNPSDSYAYAPGIELRLSSNYTLVPMTRWERSCAAVGRLWRRLTWWRYPHVQVISVDHERGELTVDTVVWSWRRWKWVQRGG